MSKLWVYLSSRRFNDVESQEIQLEINQFTRQWVSHNHSLSAKGTLLYNRFIILEVDETNTGASGCSIDSSVHFLQKLGQKYQTDFFNRLNFAYKNEEGLQVVDKDEFTKLYQNGIINDETIVYNTLVKNTQEFQSNWSIPLKESWHKNFV